MATVQIAFTDNSDNETKFTVFRSVNAQSVTGVPAEKLATLEWDAGNTVWTYTKEAVDTNGDNDGAFVGTAPNTAPNAVGQSFTISYTESTAGAYKFGVEAENAIGKSAVTETSAAITIA
jgi:hypothetical protein